MYKKINVISIRNSIGSPDSSIVVSTADELLDSGTELFNYLY